MPTRGQPRSVSGSPARWLPCWRWLSASGYALHLLGADHWRLAGFTVTGAQKGIMAERSGHTVLSHLAVGNVGQEAVHLDNFSSDNVVRRSLLHDTGTVEPRFGEGLYLGSAESN